MEVKVLASGSSGNSYLISEGEESILLDAGIPFKRLQALSGHKMLDVSGCLITHSHQDHIKAASDLMRFGVDCYVSKGEQERAGLKKHHRLKTIESGKAFDIGSFRVYPFKTVHDTPEPLGFYIISKTQSLAYFTDTASLNYSFPNVDIIMAECNYSKAILQANVRSERVDMFLAERLLRSHMSLEELLRILKRDNYQRLKKVYLMHLSNTNSDEALFKEEVQKATGVEVIVC